MITFNQCQRSTLRRAKVPTMAELMMQTVADNKAAVVCRWLHFVPICWSKRNAAAPNRSTLTIRARTYGLLMP